MEGGCRKQQQQCRSTAQLAKQAAQQAAAEVADKLKSCIVKSLKNFAVDKLLIMQEEARGSNSSGAAERSNAGHSTAGEAGSAAGSC